MNEQLETSTINRIYWRIIPLLFAMMFFNYLDRINIGFAALDMNKDLGFSPAVFGFAGSIFFVGYMVLEVPSNLMLHWVGARRWIARILLTWGAVAAATAFVSTTGASTCCASARRDGSGLLAGRGGLSDLWFPVRYRARAVGGYIIAGAFSAVLGGPISTALMTYANGFAGLHGWQWMFIARRHSGDAARRSHAAYHLTDRPADADWLADDEEQLARNRRCGRDAKRSTATRIYRCCAWRATSACGASRACSAARWSASTACSCGCRRSSRASAV